jgi:glycosyltransferase involved in cell wall biosynthesis
MSIQRDRVRLYHRIRSAHLERAAQLPAATILYGDQRYDFQSSLATNLDLVQARGVRAAWYLFRHRVSVLEVNEPLMLGGIRSSALALVGLSLRRLTGQPRTRVVSYAIENLDPRSRPRPARWRSRVARRVDRGLGVLVWRRLDRIAYGTPAAQQLYRSALPAPGRRLRSALVPALPAPAEQGAPPRPVTTQVLFLGAFSERKGLPLVLEAWPLVLEQIPQARLSLVGQGKLQPLAQKAASTDPSITVLVGPPRQRIRELLRTSQVLVLPSQPQPGWREQVGLPIVEALSFGCTVVTTTETGLADWLLGHGHQVLDPGGTAAQLAAAVAAALRRPLDRAEVLSSLPAQDGRLAADAWLFAFEPDTDSGTERLPGRSAAVAGGRCRGRAMSTDA